jgi:probable O-glycosylation ligase (exosortase A-associated)
LISLIAMGGWLVFTSRQKFGGLLLFLCGGILVLMMAPDAWFSRMDTIGDAQQDSSFMARVEAWQVSSAIAMQNPFTGGGLHAVQVQSVWAMFRGRTGLLSFVESGPPSEIFRAAHSIYFEVLGDMGFTGLLLFLAILLVGMRNGRRTEALLTTRKAEYEWAIDLSRTLSAVIFGFAVGGASVSLAYSEFIYVIVMLTEVLKREVRESLVQKSRVPVEGRYVPAG